MNHREALEAITEANMIAHRHSNGADWLECPFCGATENVMGYASNQLDYEGSGFKHDGDCPLLRARAELKRLDAESDPTP